MELDELAQSGRKDTKDSRITIFDQSHPRIMAEASRNFKSITLKERTEVQSKMLRDGNVAHTVAGGRRHQKRRVVDIGMGR